jgi:hypothetical protein
MTMEIAYTTGQHRICVKVVDVFGCDAGMVFEVNV